MKTHTFVSARSTPRSASRSQLSPLLRRATQDALTRGQVAARLTRARHEAAPAADPLTPATPALFERWFDPHLLDRLQTPLSRIRE